MWTLYIIKGGGRKKDILEDEVLNFLIRIAEFL